MRYYVTLSRGAEKVVDVLRTPGGELRVTVDGEPHAVDVSRTEGAVNVRVGNRIFDLWLERNGEDVGFVCGGERDYARVETDRSRLANAAKREGGSAGGMVKAPMPGRVVKIAVAVGDVLAAGAPVVVVEAMKMENELKTPGGGVVLKIHAAVGENVEGGAPLVELGPLEDAD